MKLDWKNLSTLSIVLSILNMVRHCWRVWPGECAGSAACCVSVKAGHVFPLMGSSRVNKQSNCKPSHSPPPATCQQSNQPTRHVYISSTCTDINIHILIYYLCLSPYKAKAFDVLFNENTHLGSKLMFLTISSGYMCRVNQCQDKSSAASLASAHCDMMTPNTSLAASRSRIIG